MTRYALPLISILLLSACGGGGGSDPVPAPMPPANRAPTFSGDAVENLTITENTTDVIANATATDPDGDTLSVALGTAADNALFIYDSSTGDLTFAAPPDFEAPQDEGADNVYNVDIIATDPFGASATKTYQITVTDVSDAAALQRVGTGLSRPVGLIPIPGDTRLAVVEQRGRIRLLDPATGAIDSVDFLTLDGLASGNEQGLLGLAFAPDFESSGEFYVHLNVAGSGDTQIRRYATMSGRRDMGDPATADVILEIAQPRNNHNAGWIGFAQDGTLIIPTGDGGGAGDPDNFAQNPQSLLGKVLRIDVSGDDFPNDDARDYVIPDGNAYDDASDGLPEIYALGLRNPFQSSIDPESGDLLIGEVGQGEREEINRLSLTDGAGTNFGWRILEGTRDFNIPADGAPDDLTAPAAEYAHDATDRGGFSVTGGVAYQGELESLQGQYLFADFVTDNLWALPLDDLGNDDTIAAEDFTVLTPNVDVGDISGISAFATGPDGTAYIVMLRGDIYAVIAED